MDVTFAACPEGVVRIAECAHACIMWTTAARAGHGAHAGEWTDDADESSEMRRAGPV
jgi:hypothetical protein